MNVNEQTQKQTSTSLIDFAAVFARIHSIVVMFCVFVSLYLRTENFSSNLHQNIDLNFKENKTSNIQQFTHKSTTTTTTTTMYVK